MGTWICSFFNVCGKEKLTTAPVSWQCFYITNWSRNQTTTSQMNCHTFLINYMSIFFYWYTTKIAPQTHGRTTKIWSTNKNMRQMNKINHIVSWLVLWWRYIFYDFHAIIRVNILLWSFCLVMAFIYFFHYI